MDGPEKIDAHPRTSIVFAGDHCTVTERLIVCAATELPAAGVKVTGIVYVPFAALLLLLEPQPARPSTAPTEINTPSTAIHRPRAEERRRR